MIVPKIVSKNSLSLPPTKRTKRRRPGAGVKVSDPCFLHPSKYNPEIRVAHP